MKALHCIKARQYEQSQPTNHADTETGKKLGLSNINNEVNFELFSCSSNEVEGTILPFLDTLDKTKKLRVRECSRPAHELETHMHTYMHARAHTHTHTHTHLSLIHI